MILIDPPYSLARAEWKFGKTPWEKLLSKGGILFVEESKIEIAKQVTSRTLEESASLCELKVREYGDTRLTSYTVVGNLL